MQLYKLGSVNKRKNTFRFIVQSESEILVTWSLRTPYRQRISLPKKTPSRTRMVRKNSEGSSTDAQQQKSVGQQQHLVVYASGTPRSLQFLEDIEMHPNPGKKGCG